LPSASELPGQVDSDLVSGLGLLLVAAARGQFGLGEQLFLPLADGDVAPLLGLLDGLGRRAQAALLRLALLLAKRDGDVGKILAGLVGLERLGGGRDGLMEQFGGLGVVPLLVVVHAGAKQVLALKNACLGLGPLVQLGPTRLLFRTQPIHLALPQEQGVVLGFVSPKQTADPIDQAQDRDFRLLRLLFRRRQVRRLLGLWLKPLRQMPAAILELQFRGLARPGVGAAEDALPLAHAHAIRQHQRAPRVRHRQIGTRKRQTERALARQALPAHHIHQFHRNRPAVVRTLFSSGTYTVRPGPRAKFFCSSDTRATTSSAPGGRSTAIYWRARLRTS